MPIARQTHSYMSDAGNGAGGYLPVADAPDLKVGDTLTMRRHGFRRVSDSTMTVRKLKQFTERDGTQFWSVSCTWA